MKPIALNLNSFISKLLSWVIVLSVFSYPISAVLILQIGLPGSTSNFIIRILLSALYIILLLFAILKGGKKWSIYLMPTIVFLMLYSLRLIFDISIRGVQILEYSNFYVYSYYFGLTLLPCFAIIGARKFIDFKNLINLSFKFLLLSNILLMYQMLTQGENLSFVDVLATRAQARIEGEDRVFINPIVVGFFGANLSLFSISSLIVGKSKSLLKIILGASICLGIVNLLFGASRGPMIVFVLLLFVIVLYYLSHEENKTRLFLRVSSTILVLTILVNQYILPFISKTEIFLFSRFESFIKNRGKGKKEVRDYSYEGAWNDFLDSPVWGKQYVGTYDNFYPHNIPLEVLMSMGVIGAFIYCAILFSLAVSFFIFWNRPYLKYRLPILICGIAAFLFTITSGAIFFSPNYWIFIIIIIIAHKQDKHDKILLGKIF